MSDHITDEEVQAVANGVKLLTTTDFPSHNQDQKKSLKEHNHAVSSSMYHQTTLDNNAIPFERKLPALNLPEKVLFVVDTITEQQCTQFKLGTGATFAPLYLVKRAMDIFVGVKAALSDHKFALMTFNSQHIQWNCDFTDSKNFLTHLYEVEEEIVPKEPESYDLGLIFKEISSHVPLAAYCDETTFPTHVTRVILIYARSNCIPIIETEKAKFEDLIENPYFFLDILFVHEPLSNENKCEEVYEKLNALERANFSYILEVGRNPAKLHDSIAKLIAHPLQRPLQADTCYSTSPLYCIKD